VLLANNKDEVEDEKIDDSLHNKRFQRSLLSSDQSKDDHCVKTIKKMQDLLNQFTEVHVQFFNQKGKEFAVTATLR